MRSKKHFFVTAALLVFMGAFGWRSGYAAASEGAGTSLLGGFYVVVGFAIVAGSLRGLLAVWRMSTAAGPGVSPLRHIAMAVGIVLTAMVLTWALVPLALEENSFGLGILMSVTLAALSFLAWYDGLLEATPVEAYTGPETEESVSLSEVFTP